MENGLILQGIGGFYTVVLESGERVECKARGRFRKEKITPLAGDRVSVLRTADELCRLEEILPRRNVFVRPPVANIDLMVIVGSLALPKSDPFLLDRVTAVCENKGIRPVLVFNKQDLVPTDSLAETYRRVGYPVIITSAETGEGIEELRKLLVGFVSAFTGNSGVGKSSLLRRLEPSFDLAVGEISLKLGRGRHTTRAVTLLPLTGGGYVADTPGFSSFDPEKMELLTANEVEQSFAEFSRYREQCRFHDCRHIGAAGCAVIAACERGEIPESRYLSYRRLLEQARKPYG